MTTAEVSWCGNGFSLVEMELVVFTNRHAMKVTGAIV